ncbi:tRNA (guanosine(46)-N7)-methyltransferase TrmB [Hellea sp.]|nr:tRNA (guanosine(46)-N7)-methyltransferase TrmB [Hellea sp.]
MFNRETNSFRTFGRAKGKPLSPAQAALMETEFPKVDFGPAVKAGQNPIADVDGQVWLEIGFGGAEHLIWQAEQNPSVTLLGVEPFLNGVAKAVRGLVDKELNNIRLHRGDARDVLRLLPDESLDCVFVLFPDPWPKARHNKRRIINMNFLEELHRVIVPGGRFRFGSDIIDYVDWTLTRVKRHGGFDWPATAQEQWRVRPHDWPSTRYLEKALREGRNGHFFEFIRK